MYPAALHKIPTQTVYSSQVLAKSIRQKQPQIIKSITKNWNKNTTRKWHSESADPAKALNLSLAKQTNKQTDKQKILAKQMFELSTLAFLAQFSYRLSYRAVLI